MTLASRIYDLIVVEMLVSISLLFMHDFIASAALSPPLVSHLTIIPILMTLTYCGSLGYDNHMVTMM